MDDHFSFPTMISTEQDPRLCQQLPFPHFDASPLWFDCSRLRRRRSLSSSSEEAAAKIVDVLKSAELSNEDEDGDELGEGKSGGCWVDSDEEQKMDMLWEEFNEEEMINKEDSRSSNEQQQQQQALALSRVSKVDGAALLQQRRPAGGLAGMLKKKLFLQLKKTNSTNKSRRTSLVFQN